MGVGERQEHAERTADRPGRAGRVRQGRARRVQARCLCAPGRAGWAVGCALGALSLF